MRKKYKKIVDICDDITKKQKEKQEEAEEENENDEEDGEGEEERKAKKGLLDLRKLCKTFIIKAYALQIVLKTERYA